MAIKPSKIIIVMALLTLAGCNNTSTTTSAPTHHSRSSRLAIQPKQAEVLGYVIAWAQNLKLPTNQSITEITCLDEYLFLVEQPTSVISAISLSDGRLLWQKVVGEKGEQIFQPFTFEHMVCVNSEVQMYQIDIHTGKLTYAFKLHAPVASQPLLIGNKVIYGGISGNVFAQNIQTGMLEWSYQLTNRIHTAPVQHHNSVFAADGNGVYALINAQTGEMIWRNHTYGPIVCSAMVDNNTVYIASQDQSLYAINLKSGSDDWIFKTTFPLTISPSIIGEILYMNVPKQNLLYAVNRGNGTEIWHRQNIGQPITLVDNQLLLARQSSLVLAGPDSGRMIMETPTSKLHKVLAMTNNSLILITPQGQLIRLNPKQ